MRALAGEGPAEAARAVPHTLRAGLRFPKEPRGALLRRPVSASAAARASGTRRHRYVDSGAPQRESEAVRPEARGPQPRLAGPIGPYGTNHARSRRGTAGAGHRAALLSGLSHGWSTPRIPGMVRIGAAIGRTIRRAQHGPRSNLTAEGRAQTLGGPFRAGISCPRSGSRSPRRFPGSELRQPAFGTRRWPPQPNWVHRASGRVAVHLEVSALPGPAACPAAGYAPTGSAP